MWPHLLNASEACVPQTGFSRGTLTCIFVPFLQTRQLNLWRDEVTYLRSYSTERLSESTPVLSDPKCWVLCLSCSDGIDTPYLSPNPGDCGMSEDHPVLSGVPQTSLTSDLSKQSPKELLHVSDVVSCFLGGTESHSPGF